jgi:signal peptidase I
MKSKKKNFVEETINYFLAILILIFGIVLLISIYTSVQTKILGNDYSDFFGYSIFEVQTGSMADTINAGDWVIVKLTQKVELNDIVTYELGGEYITHRVIEVYSNTYITKGDANSGKDDPIKQDQIVGKVVKDFY